MKTLDYFVVFCYYHNRKGKKLLQKFSLNAKMWYTKNTDSRMREFLEDACVKRFEFSLEISWKTMKRFLKLEYSKNDTELTMNNIFRT